MTFLPYTVSFQLRRNITVNARSYDEAVQLACPWWNGQQPADGNMLLGVAKGHKPLESGLKAPPRTPAPPTGPQPGTPVLESLLQKAA